MVVAVVVAVGGVVVAVVVVAVVMAVGGVVVVVAVEEEKLEGASRDTNCTSNPIWEMRVASAKQWEGRYAPRGRGM